MADKLRKLREQGLQLVRKGKLQDALETYQKVLSQEPSDLMIRLRCGDLLRKLGRAEDAVGDYARVAEAYAADGLLLKAIAACKLVLEVDSTHTATQKMLADLYAKKTGRAAAAGVRPTPPPIPARPSAGDVEEIEDDEIISIEEDAAPAAELPTIPLFSDLSKNAFIQLMEQMSMRTVLPDEVVICEGDSGESMFIISSGRVKVTKTLETGAEMVLAELGDGTFFGEMALLSDSPRTATVIAIEETMLFEVSRKTLDQVVGNFPSVKHILNRFYRQRLLSQLMATSPLFESLNAEERKGLIEKFKSREVGANQKVLGEGDKADGLYMLLVGRAEVAKDVNGERKVIAHMKGGDVFGEVSLIDNAAASSSVRTLTKCIVLKLPRRTFTDVATTHPQIAEHVGKLNAERQKTTEAIMRGQLDFRDEGLVVV